MSSSAFSFITDPVLRIGGIADKPEDDEHARLRHRFLIYMGVLMSGGGILWGSISFAFGLYLAAVIPYGYVVLTVINLGLLNATKRFVPARNFQVLISLLLPFLFQYSLGGFISSGAVMLWAMLALCGSLTFSEARQSIAWLVLYGGLTVASGVIDPLVRARFAIDTTEDVHVAFLVTNFTVISTIVFGLMIYLTARQQAATDALQSANALITELNTHLEEQVADRTQQLRTALAERQAILDNLADGLIATDAAGGVTLRNPALHEQFGLDGQGEETADGEALEPLLVLLKEARSSAEVLTAEIPMTRERIGSVSAAAVRGDDGEAQGVVALVRDVTLEKEIDRMKTDFIATVSHEMRTPLTSVMGFAKITTNKLETRVLQHVPAEDKKAMRAVDQVRKNMQIIVSEGERLTTLINDVLDISKMEAGRMDWHMDAVDVAGLVQRAADASQSLFADPEGPQLVLEVAEELPQLYGDHDRLLQVLLNLISNAAKFTDEGTVTLGASAVEEGVELYVRDTGEGISLANQEAVFEKFRQVGDTLTSKPTGTGLGLPICRQIVEAHEGQITVQSALGEGATFRVVLPLKTSETPVPNRTRATRTPPVPASRSEPPPITDESERPQVLVVDDDANLRELLRIQLSERGYDVRLAINGNDAVAKIRASRPDVVVLDVKMPDLSGYDVAAMLRNDPETESIPIMMLSILEDRERGARVGVDHHMTKPADPDELAGVVGQLAGARTSHRHVLVVDDRSSTADDLSRLLTSKGFKVESTDSDEVLAVARDARPDLILLDASTPGHEDLVRAIRFEKGLEHVLVVQLNERGPDGTA